jgi:hypothetical protein
MSPNPYESPREIETNPPPRPDGPTRDQLLWIIGGSFLFATLWTFLTVAINWLTGRPLK